MSSRPLDLREAQLQSGKFAHAELIDADLRRANLQLADLASADLRGARLTWADLTCATLAHADLRNADLSEADLSGADLRRADLRGALLDGATLAHAWTTGARGLPQVFTRTNDRLPGPTLPNHADEPEAGLQAFERGRKLHAEGKLVQAERAYLLARAWQPDSDVVPYALACLALDRDDPETARHWLETTLQVAPEADRALLELTLLTLATGPALLAGTLFADLQARLPELSPLQVATAEPTLRRLTGNTALQAWLDRQQQPEQAEQPQQAEGQALVAQAIAVGDLPLAHAQLQRLDPQEPMTALWRLLLPKLDATATAMDALLRTRRPPLGPIQALRWQSLGAHGATARLETADGVLWVQRLAGPLRSAQSLGFTHRVQEHLATLGMRVPRWLTDDRDAPIFAFDGDWLQVSHDLGGAPFTPTLANCHIAGQTLAAIHTAPAPEERRPSGGLRTGVHVLTQATAGATWLEMLASEPALRAQIHMEPLFARVAPLLDLTARRLQDALPACPQGLCHGDFAPQNLLVEADGGLAVLDWEFADWQPLVWDLARALDVFAVRWPARAEEPPRIDRPRLRAFLRGYTTVRPLAPPEWVALPLLIAASRIDLDTGLLAFLTPLDPDIVGGLLPSFHARLTRAAAGAPELTSALSTF
jgi:Ser/Thr protein kinase RdoA (MazF antagonist)